MRKFNFGGNKPGRKPLFARPNQPGGQSSGRPIFGFGKKHTFQSRPRMVAPNQAPIDQEISVMPIDPIRTVSPGITSAPLSPVDATIPGQHEGIVVDKDVVSPNEEIPFYKKPEVLIGGAILLGGLLFFATRKKSKK